MMMMMMMAAGQAEFWQAQSASGCRGVQDGHMGWDMRRMKTGSREGRKKWAKRRGGNEWAEDK